MSIDVKDVIQQAAVLRGLPLVWMTIDAANDAHALANREYGMRLHGERWEKEFEERKNRESEAKT